MSHLSHCKLAQIKKTSRKPFGRMDRQQFACLIDLVSMFMSVDPYIYIYLQITYHFKTLMLNHVDGIKMLYTMHIVSVVM